ncbi:lysophospholipase [bacterium]|nr:lysophospholipase [bacterium]
MIEWFSNADAKPRGLVLVVHGLNLKPDRMRGIISILMDDDLDVLLLSLQGHGSNFKKQEGKSDAISRLNALKEVSAEIWRSEMQAAHAALSRRADSLNCPVYFVAYSLGGLLGCDLQLSFNHPVFAKMVLFAPALATHRIRVPFFRLFHLFSRLVIPSLSPESYRSNRGTSVAAYLSLLNIIRAFKARASINLNIPTLVFIDRNDELVSLSKVNQLIADHQLDQWRVYPIERHPDQLRYPFYHLLIDEEATGSDLWAEIRQMMINHLSPG